MKHEVQVLCDGKPIPLVPFVEELLGATLAAMIGSLKGAEGAKEITVSVKTPGK
jgi:hypothetical protein